MISSVLDIAATGMTAAASAVDTYANTIANTVTQDYAPQAAVFSPLVTGGVAVFAQEAGSAPDPLADMMGMILAANQYQAAASLVPTGLDLQATLLQTVA